MALDGTYAGLRASVADFLHRSDLTGVIPDLILVAEKRIFREVRCRAMESTLSGTIANGVISVPSDFLELKYAYINATPSSKLTKASVSQIYDQFPNRVASGKPTAIAREGTSFIFGPYPDAAYAVLGTYYAQPTSIATTANALYVANPDLYLYATLCEAAPYIKDDPRVQLWESKLTSIMVQITNERMREESEGGGMQVQTA